MLEDSIWLQKWERWDIYYQYIWDILEAFISSSFARCVGQFESAAFRITTIECMRFRNFFSISRKIYILTAVKNKNLTAHFPFSHTPVRNFPWSHKSITRFLTHHHQPHILFHISYFDYQSTNYHSGYKLLSGHEVWEQEMVKILAKMPGMDHFVYQ